MITLNIEAPAVTTTVYAWGPHGVTVVQTQDVTLNIIPDSQKVRAWVNRQGMRTFFAKTLAQAVRPREGDGDRVGDQLGRDRQLPEAVRASRHVVRGR